MSKSADARLTRLLALVPWVAARQGPAVAEVCARFGCTEQELVDDLQLLFMCGLYPYTPDMLIDADIADGRVWIRYAEYFSRPLRLTPSEGLALLVAGSTLMAAPGGDPDGPLARGLAKLAAALGVDTQPAVEISLAPAAADAVRPIEEAIADQRQIEIEYYAFGRDEWSTRVIDPHALFSAGGQWYLSAHCHAVDDGRIFRLDRISRVRVLTTRFPAPEKPTELAVYRPGPEDERVTLELDPEARWVAEQYPVERSEGLDDGALRVTLAVSQRAWLERLLLRLGPRGRVVSGDPEVGRQAARRLLRRYRVNDEAAGGGWGSTPPSTTLDGG